MVFFNFSKIFRILFSAFFLFFFLTLSCGAVYQWIATKIDKRKYPPPGKLVDIGGYSLHIHESGKGCHTVVLEAGFSSDSLEWFFVEPKIATFARVCSYDRAGYGWSEESPLPRTSIQMVKELHSLLKNAKILPPYILIGHSFGGINVSLYACTYPEEVEGIILVDSSHEDQEVRLPPDPETSFLEKFLQLKPVFLFNSYIGLQRLVIKSTVAQPMLKLSSYPTDVQEIYKAHFSATHYARTVYEENKNFSTSLLQLKTSQNSFGNTPLIVLTAGRNGCAEEYETPQQWLDTSGKIWRECLQKELISKSTCGEQRIIDSDHMITRNQPDTIVEAVRDVIKKISNNNLRLKEK